MKAKITIKIYEIEDTSAVAILEPDLAEVTYKAVAKISGTTVIRTGKTAAEAVSDMMDYLK